MNFEMPLNEDVDPTCAICGWPVKRWARAICDSCGKPVCRGHKDSAKIDFVVNGGQVKDFYFMCDGCKQWASQNN